MSSTVIVIGPCHCEICKRPTNTDGENEMPVVVRAVRRETYGWHGITGELTDGPLKIWCFTCSHRAQIACAGCCKLDTVSSMSRCAVCANYYCCTHDYFCGTCDLLMCIKCNGGDSDRAHRHCSSSGGDVTDTTNK